MAKDRTLSLRAARSGCLEDFISAHEGDPKGDADKLDALLKRPVPGSGSEVPPASSRAEGDD